MISTLAACGGQLPWHSVDDRRFGQSMMVFCECALTAIKRPGGRCPPFSASRLLGRAAEYVTQDHRKLGLLIWLAQDFQLLALQLFAMHQLLGVA
jgi:hypothetical protein